MPVDGIVPLAWSLDHVGPFARSVADAALVLASLPGARRPGAGRRRAWRWPQLFDRADAGLRQHLDAVVKRLAAAGGEVSEVALPPEFASTRPGT